MIATGEFVLLKGRLGAELREAATRFAAAKEHVDALIERLRIAEREQALATLDLYQRASCMRDYPSDYPHVTRHTIFRQENLDALVEQVRTETMRRLVKD